MDAGRNVPVRFTGAASIAVLILVLVAIPAIGQDGGRRFDEMEFRNQPITDILVALGQLGNVSIIADETVTGTASYYFTDTTFRRALDQFLEAYNLHYQTRNGVYYVSRVGVEYRPETNTVSLAVDSMDLTAVVRALSRSIAKTILYDPLPAERITMTVESVAPSRLLSIIMRRYEDYIIEDEVDYFYIRRVDQDELAPPPPEEPDIVTRDGESFTLEVQTARFREVLHELFRVGRREYSLFVQGDTVLQDLRFAALPFDDLLRLVLDHGSADYTVENGIYRIFAVQRRDILRRFATTVSLPLRHLGVQQLPTLLPPELAAADLYRLDQESNTVVLSGSEEQIAPLVSFIETIDVAQANRPYHRFDLRYIPVAQAIAALPQRYVAFRPTAVPGSNAFVIALPEEMRAELSQYVELLDVSRQGHPITLRYLKASQLLANLPPSVSAGQIVPTGMPEVVFFRGSSASLDAFKRELSIIDRPRPQIRYELLIVQYEESDRLSTETTTTGRRYDGRAEQGILGQVGSLLSLNFDIISTFGYQFAVDLTAQLANQEARVLADTTLNGLSGEKLSFRNTSTFRFREPETDSDTEETRNTGVVTEITSGLILTVNGWTSGDGMITMDVSATVSKRVNADTGARDELPGTSERVVNTHVRTESGKPVIISGLLQQETNLSETKVPILGDIPILGRLFRSSTESVDTTELAIYIVPHVERSPDEEAHIGRAFETMYRRHREAR